MKPNYKHALIIASSFFLSEEFPNTIDLMYDDEVESFVEDNIWEPLESMGITETIDQIYMLANTLVKIDEEGLNKS